jgi:hypothetical protein
MGRQVQLSVLPADVHALMFEMPDCGFVEIVAQRGQSASLKPLSVIPQDSHSSLILWHKRFAPCLQRKFIASAETSYYRIDEDAEPVLQFSPSVLTEWQGRPALTQGRIYGIFDGKQPEFQKWYERIARIVRRRWRKNPVPWLSGYLGPAASEWFDSGGLLLPFFVPPVTKEWIYCMDEQHSKP